MARYYSSGSKSYRLVATPEGSFYEEDGDTIQSGISTAGAWLNDNEKDATFEIGDTFSGVLRYIGKIAIPLESGGSVFMPVRQNMSNPNLVFIESSIFPLDPDLDFPDTLDINALNKGPFHAILGPTSMNDNFKGLNEGESVNLGTGRDIFRALAGDDYVLGGEGRDKIFGQGGDDTLKGDGAADKLFGGAGEDRLYGAEGADLLKGGRGADMLYGDDGRDKLYGGGGGDELDGGDGRDKLFGGRGDDSFDDGAGNDVMVGGAGSDTFYFSVSQYNPVHGRDRIRGFNEDKDEIWLFVDDPDEVTVRHSSGDTIIEYDAGTIILVGTMVDADSDALIFI